MADVVDVGQVAGRDEGDCMGLERNRGAGRSEPRGLEQATDTHDEAGVLCGAVKKTRRRAARAGTARGCGFGGGRGIVAVISGGKGGGDSMLRKRCEAQSAKLQSQS